jgi:hypothetical protein
MGVRFRMAAAHLNPRGRRIEPVAARRLDAAAHAQLPPYHTYDLAARLTLTATVLTLGTTTYAVVTGQATLALAGLLTSVVITALHVRDSIHSAERSSHLLTRALAESERVRGDLQLANEQLLRTNANLRTLQIAVAQGFNLIDERTRGRLRRIVEEAGDDLAALVEETLVDED